MYEQMKIAAYLNLTIDHRGQHINIQAALPIVAFKVPLGRELLVSGQAVASVASDDGRDLFRIASILSPEHQETIWGPIPLGEHHAAA